MSALSDLLATHWIALFSVTLLGSLLIGSFLNVVILRLPIMLFRNFKQDYSQVEFPKHPALDDLNRPFNLVKPHSHCPHCQTPIAPWHNIPLLSWCLLRGRCAQCQTSIAWRYPVIELLTALFSVTLIWVFPWGWSLAAMLFFTWILIALSVIDIDHQLLPDTLTLGLLWLGLIANSFGLFTSLEHALWGAVWGYGILWAVYWLFKLTTGKEGMGYGDFKLLAALGAWLGADSLIQIILISSIVGALIGIVGIVLQGRDKNLPIPFGPYLALAGWITAVFGSKIAIF